MTGRIKVAYLFSFLISFFTVSANAATCCPYPASWYVELEPFYVKIHDDLFSNRSFAQARIFDGGCHREEFGLDNRNWDFGFKVALGYDFASCTPCHNGLSLEYTRFTADNDRTLRFDNALLFSGFSSFVFGPFSDAHADLDTTYDTVDLLAHRTYVYCNCANINYFAGIRYLRLDHDLDVDFNVVDEFGEDRLHHRFEHDVKGLGGRIGVNGFLPIGRCFGVNAEVAGSLLYGWHDHDRHNVFNEVAVTDLGEEHHDDRHHRAIPAVSGELGLAYQTTYCGCNKLKLELGYRYDCYYNLNDDGLFDPDCDCNDHHRSHDHDFEFSGPYAKASFHF